MDFNSRLVVIADILDGLDLHQEANLVDGILCKISSLQLKITQYSQSFSLEDEKKVLFQLAKILVEIQGEPLEKRVEVSLKIPPFRNPWEKLFYSGDNVSGYPKKTVVKAIQLFIEMYVRDYMQDKFKQLGNNIEYGHVIDNVMNLSSNLEKMYGLKKRKGSEKLLSSFDRGLAKAKQLYIEVETIAVKAKKYGVDFTIRPLDEAPKEDYREEDAIEEVHDKILEEGLNNIETKEGDELFKTFKDFMTEGFKEFKEIVTPRQMGKIIKEIGSNIENEDFLEQYKAEGTVEKLAEDVQSFYNNQYYLRKAFREVLKTKEPRKKERQLSTQNEEEEKIIDTFKQIIFSLNNRRKIYGQENTPQKEKEVGGSFKALSNAISIGYKEVDKVLSQLEDQRDVVLKLLPKDAEQGKKNEAIKKLDFAIEKFREYKENLKSVYKISKKLREPMNPFLDLLLTFLSGEKETEKEKWENLHKKMMTDWKELKLGRFLESPHSREEYKKMSLEISKEEINEALVKFNRLLKDLFEVTGAVSVEGQKNIKSKLSEILDDDYYKYETEYEDVTKALSAKLAEEINKIEKVEEKDRIEGILSEIAKLNGARTLRDEEEKSSKKEQGKIRRFVKVGGEDLSKEENNPSANELLKDNLIDFNMVLDYFQNIAQKYFGNEGEVKRQSDNLLKSMKENRNTREKYKAHINIIEKIFGDVGESGMLGKYSVGNIAQYKEIFEFDIKEKGKKEELSPKQELQEEKVKELFNRLKTELRSESVERLFWERVEKKEEDAVDIVKEMMTAIERDEIAFDEAATYEKDLTGLLEEIQKIKGEVGGYEERVEELKQRYEKLRSHIEKDDEYRVINDFFHNIEERQKHPEDMFKKMKMIEKLLDGVELKVAEQKEIQEKQEELKNKKEPEETGTAKIKKPAGSFSKKYIKKTGRVRSFCILNKQVSYLGG